MMRWEMANRRVFITGPQGNLGPVWRKWCEDMQCSVFGAGLPEYDLTDAEQQQRAVDDCMDTIGAPDILIHNAAVDNPPGSRASFFGGYRRIIDVNLIAAVEMTERFLAVMTASYAYDFQQRPRNIVFIGSMLGFVASNTQLYGDGFDKPLGYGAAKAALWNFCKNLNVRYARQGVVANMLALSAVEGGQDEAFKAKYCQRTPIGRLLQPEDFRNEFLTACSARVPWGQPLLVCGGYTIW